MSPRILGCLVIAIAAAALAFVWTIVAGHGVILAIAAYSIAGSLALVSASAIALAFESDLPVPVRRQGDDLLATIRTG